MNSQRGPMKAIATATVAAFLLLAACGSDANSTLEAVEADAAAEAVPSTPTEAPSPQVTEPTAVVAKIAEGTINIETEVPPPSEGRTPAGTFVVDQGADVLGCSSGSVVQGPSPQGIFNAFTCEDGDREGTFTFVWSIIDGSDGPGDFNGPWSVLDTTGDFAGLTGEGLWSGVNLGQTGLSSFPGVIEFGPAEATAEADPAIVADLTAYVVAYTTGDTEVAWDTASARCQEALGKEFLDESVVQLTLIAPGATVSDISTVVEGDRAAVTYFVYDDAGVLFTPYYAQPWIFADGNWHQDAC